MFRLYSAGEKLLTAVDNVNFGINHGSIVSIVGESGSGKTTLVKCLLNLLVPNSGDINFMGKSQRVFRQ